MGFTITELVVAAAIGLLTASVAGQALVSHLESSERAEAMERQRNDWARTTHFIESEIALSERLIKNIDNIIVPSVCDIAEDENEFRLAIDMRRDLPIVIYAVKQSTLNWLPKNTLWRCGPGLKNDGSYNNTIEFERLLDGLDGTVEEGGGFILGSNTANSSKYTDFVLALKGHATVKYGQVTAARSRISPLYTRPTVKSLCDASNMVKVKGTSGNDTISAQNISVLRGEDILLCGYGGGDNITGSDANDIIEAGDTGSSTLTGGPGNDVLRGTDDADTLIGGPGNDVLVGRGGNDKLVGDIEAQDIGDDQNIYLPGNGNDTIQGGEGLDIIFFNGNQGEYTIIDTTESPCNTESCTVVETSENETKTINNSEILIFNNARLDLPDP
ncbi:MAG: hypothetical protein ACJ0GX_00020 [Parasynechococcus sp.]|jgi:hypothetical protein|uniref:hypothetical protein n=1 Tax=Parasynechococcus sp. TaxID=3101203 RepID=UPI0038839EA1